MKCVTSAGFKGDWERAVFRKKCCEWHGSVDYSISDTYPVKITVVDRKLTCQIGDVSVAIGPITGSAFGGNDDGNAGR